MNSRFPSVSAEVLAVLLTAFAVVLLLISPAGADGGGERGRSGELEPSLEARAILPADASAVRVTRAALPVLLESEAGSSTSRASTRANRTRRSPTTAPPRRR